MSLPDSNSPAALWQRPMLAGTRDTLLRLIPQLQHAGLSLDAACTLVVDDVIASLPESLMGLPVLGEASDLALVQGQVQASVLVVCLPAAQRAAALALKDAARSLQLPVRMIAPLHEQVLQGGSQGGSQGGTLAATSPQHAGGLSTINWAELIGRVPFGLDKRAVAGALSSKRVLITGAGGSIGSEIARIVASFGPSLLVLMERSENALFEIDRTIAKKFPHVPRKAVLHDVVDHEQTLRHLLQLKPHVVFHAAAHKHVPLMEDHPSHAVTNNLFGTKAIADAALATGAERFVFISTDKAVEPSSTMGATKRLAELYVQHIARTQVRSSTRPVTRCSIVRFGNVLGSACSVLPIWESQLVEGGPLTVTDERMTRFFMTIHEAATLVIQSSTLVGEEAGLPSSDSRQFSTDYPNGTIFVLDMGEPIRILDLATRFVRLRGFDPVVDAQPSDQPTPQPMPQGDAPPMRIALTGARPGEKLHEALAYPAEALSPTSAPGIFALAVGDWLVDVPAMVAEFGLLRHHAERTVIRAAIARVLPDFSEFDAFAATRTPKNGDVLPSSLQRAIAV
jgi:O-antigen biosynthesis protein WbqV